MGSNDGVSLLEESLIGSHNSFPFPLQESYDDEQFDEEPKLDSVSKTVEKVDEEDYSDDDEAEQFEVLKAQIYGDPDDEDDYERDYEEEVEEKPETHEPAAARLQEDPVKAPMVAKAQAKKEKEEIKVAKAPKRTPEKAPVKLVLKTEKKEAIVKVDEITQNYLKMLKTGKLAPPKKTEEEEEGDKQRPVSRGATVPSERRDSDRPQSVHEADLRRLEESSEMDLIPLMLRSRGQKEESHSPNQGRPSRSKASLATSAHNKILVPGPGQYSTSIDRFGRKTVIFDKDRPSSAACLGFGTSHRPEHFLANKDASPGPVHLPKSAIDSTKQSARTFSLGRRIEEYLPSNHPIWHPSPLEYPDAASLGSNGRFVNSRGALIHAFSKGKKLNTSAESLGGMTFISEEHSRIDNSGVFSPSKIYNKDVDAVRLTSPSITIAPRFKQGGIFYTSSRTMTPDPPESYLNPSDSPIVNRRGLPTFGAGPHPSIGNAPRDFSPERSLNQAPFISKDHCYHANQLLFSAPVGSYDIPGMENERVKSPTLNSGPADRFFDRFEPGRVG